MDRPLVYLVVTADEYELPVFCGDTSKELADFFGLEEKSRNALASRLNQSKTGIVKKDGGKYKYMRLNPNTGEVYVGKLPPKVKGYMSKEGVKSQRGPKMRAIVRRKHGIETVYANIREATAVTGYKNWQIYNAIQSGYRLHDAYWRYA